jgi:DNA-binding MarR family transcriptional regulator
VRTITEYITADTIMPPFFRYPRFLLKMDLSQTAKLLYSLLLDRSELSQKNGWQDNEGRTYIVYPVSEIAEMLDKGSTAIKAALNELDAAGLLVRERRNAAKKKELEAAEKRIAELSAIFKRLYEDSVAGRISDERFTELSADYEAEQKELKEKAAALQSELSKTLEATANAEKFMKVVRKYTSFEELTPTLLREFVEKIVIHESEALDGKRRGKLRRQEIEIYYSFVGKVELPD